MGLLTASDKLEWDWENQNGSVLTIGPIENGAFEGTFVSTKGRAASNRGYPVRGTVNGELLAFAVDFADDTDKGHSISNFTGRLAKRDALASPGAKTG